MKQIKHITLAVFMSVFMLFSFYAAAEISYATQNYLDHKDFRTAKISIESDIKNDKYDAKTWYFYSRILYQLNQPNAAKNALNNAMNIDKTGSFAKGGMANVRSFAGDIVNKIKKTTYEDPVSMPRITGAEYDRYLTSVFGSNNPYSNQNPPSSSAIKSALAKNSVSTAPVRKVEQNVKQSTSVQNNPIVSVPVSEIKHVDKSVKETSLTEKSSSGGFVKGLLIFVSLILIVFLLVAYIFKSKAKKEEDLKNQKIKGQVVDLFNKFNNLSAKIEEKMKDYEVMIPGSKLYEAMSQLYTESLNHIKSIDLNDISESSIRKINDNMKKVNEYMSILETAYNEKDYNLENYFKRLEEEAERKRKEEERLAEIRRQKEEEERIARQERERIARIQREKEKEREAEIEKERIRSGYYERKREQELQEQRERNRERERERERERDRQQYSRGNSGRSGGSQVNDMIAGAALYNLADNLLNSESKKSRNDDENNSIWGGSSSSKDDDNSSIWGNSGSSNDDDNSNLWGSNDSNDDDDSNNW